MGGQMGINDKILVAGAGGFIGGALIALLRKQGYRDLRAVDVKPFDEWYQRFDDVENLSLDLNGKENCETAAKGAVEIYNLAANMGGMGFIEHNKALCMLSVLINTHMLQAALKRGTTKRFFYASSACVYNGDKQKTFEAPSLKEEVGSVPGAGGRRLRLGEIVFRKECVPALHGGFRPDHAGGAFSQCLRPVGDLVWRARKSPGGHLPQSNRSQDFGQARN